MKTFDVWLIIEETEDDSPLNQLETCQIGSYQTEDDAQHVFQTTQDLIFAIKERLGIKEISK